MDNAIEELKEQIDGIRRANHLTYCETPMKESDRHKRHVREMSKARKPAKITEEKHGEVISRTMTEEEKEKYGIVKEARIIK